MFARTVSFWKRLLGRRSAATTTTAVRQAEEERRVWIRSLSDEDLKALLCSFPPARPGERGAPEGWLSRV
jgi:hypothetical protein